MEHVPIILLARGNTSDSLVSALSLSSRYPIKSAFTLRIPGLDLFTTTRRGEEGRGEERRREERREEVEGV